jgi:hypothetical protein
VPADQGFRFDDFQHVQHSRNRTVEPNKHQAIDAVQGCPLRRSGPQNIALVAALAALPPGSASSSSVQRPSFGRGWTSRSYSNDVSPDRSTLRTVFRDTLRSRAISLIVLPLKEMLAPNPADRLHCQRSPTTRFESKQAAHQANRRGSIFGRRSPAQGVKIARRITAKRARPRGGRRIEGSWAVP